MRFESVLDRTSAEAEPARASGPPDYFGDLNLDPVVGAVAGGDWSEYDVAPVFWAPLADVDSICYRQEVFRDLEDQRLRERLLLFLARMRSVREWGRRAEKAYYVRAAERDVLEAAGRYVDAVERLRADLDDRPLASRALVGFRSFLAEHAGSIGFRALAADWSRLSRELAEIRFGVRLNGLSVSVQPFANEADYSAAVEATFEKFRRVAAREYRSKLAPRSGMNHVDAQIVDRVARLFPDTFAALSAFRAQHARPVDPTIARFDREISFYLAYLAHVDRLSQRGLRFCLPQVSAGEKAIDVRDAFDLALAGAAPAARAPIVVNDVLLRGRERLIVVSGPNQGGKTTFARMVGQLHHLARLGCPVPGTSARLFLCDRIFTHFERQERMESLRGKLQDDLVRIRGILDQATPASLVIMNEIFSSTTLEDAVFLSRQVLGRLSELNLLAVCVTFVAELAAFDDKTVSVVSLVDPANPAIRTYRLERRPADGLAYALALAEQRRVTYARLKERIAR